MAVQVAERNQKVMITLPAPLVKKVVDMAHIEPDDGKVSDYVAKVLREAIASHESFEPEDIVESESEEIRARLKRLGYL